MTLCARRSPSARPIQLRAATLDETDKRLHAVLESGRPGSEPASATRPNLARATVPKASMSVCPATLRDIASVCLVRGINRWTNTTNSARLSNRNWIAIQRVTRTKESGGCPELPMHSSRRFISAALPPAVMPRAGCSRPTDVRCGFITDVVHSGIPGPKPAECGNCCRSGASRPSAPSHCSVQIPEQGRIGRPYNTDACGRHTPDLVPDHATRPKDGELAFTSRLCDPHEDAM